MYNRIFEAVALIVTANSALQVQCQSPEYNVSVPRTEPARWISIPYTLEVRSITVQTKADGSTDTQQGSDLTAVDLQGRRLFETTSEAGGYTSATVEDPVAGTRTVWNSNNKEAKVLMLSAPVAHRQSCWSIPAEEQHFVRGEAQLGIRLITCQPAERDQGSYCAVHGDAVAAPRDDSPEAKPDYGDCSRALASVIISGKASEKNEDLGVETILGHETHGCRSTVVLGNGTHKREAWYTKFGTARRNVSLSLRSVDEFPGPGEWTTRITSEATNLTFAEPVASVFLPPNDYAIKKIEMLEVPCKQASNPSLHAAPSH